ncbi:MAG: hypothetical protein V7606_4849 [Burkholderiales bacterium]
MRSAYNHSSQTRLRWTLILRLVREICVQVGRTPTTDTVFGLRQNWLANDTRSYMGS